MSLIQRLAESNFRASGIPMSIIDAVDATILARAGWTDMCMNFHRAVPASNQRCMESDVSMKDRLVEGEAVRYKCKNGLWHLAIPIIVAKQHLATMFLTQFYFEGEVPEREYFINQSKEFGYDMDAYLAALDRMPIFSVEKVNYIIEYDKVLVRFIADLAEHSIGAIETKKTLAESEKKYRTLVTNLNIGVYRTSPEGRFIQANPAMARIFGYGSAEELMAEDIVDLYQDSADREKLIEDLLRNGILKDRELAMQRRDGTPIWCSTAVVLQHGERGEIAWLDGVIEDVTERINAREELQKAHDELERRVVERTEDLAKTNELLLSEIKEREHIEQQLRELSEKDPLTGIFNRRKLFEILGFEVEKAERYTRPLSVLIFDLDHFKKVNDTFGHNIGDEALKTVANIVTGAIRKADLLARYGGEEFVVVLMETRLADAVITAERIRFAVEQHCFPGAGRITVSIGAAEFAGKENNAAALIARADEALMRPSEAVETGWKQPQAYHDSAEKVLGGVGSDLNL